MQVVTISANSDTEIGQFIADAMERVVKEGERRTSISRRRKKLSTRLKIRNDMYTCMDTMCIAAYCTNLNHYFLLLDENEIRPICSFVLLNVSYRF